MKVLVISKGSPVVKPQDHEVVHVEPREGLLSFAAENPDIIFCYAECGVGTTEETKLLEDLRNSVSSGQKLIRVGFTTGGPDKLLRLPFSRDELQECLR